MIKIKNRLHQPLIVNIKGKKPLRLSARGVVDIPEKDIEGSAQLGNLISRGDVSILMENKGGAAKESPKAGKEK